ncbi:putative 2-dehydropantoate 2-reductase [Geobacter sp. DSM 9736]|uniref:putative 2-dehydropantoate 2-reductase n=1 Tax=Geobacter sp. DSM 9736 TaxID=1277350 RepID=UPI000B506E07|nr:putative 2-dehydropantoate 2-reductase [Geobacter sp. DSM 9736]SNB44620.1 ketopantoate reductase [Geobacter sp. DSM 9736]
MRIAVVGAGALGLYYGALLQKSGEDVHFLLRRDYDAITRQGLKVFSIDGDFALPHVQGYRKPQEIGPVDLVLVGLKTFANDRYAELIPPLVGESTLILTLQNGLGNEEALAELFGRERIVGGVAFLCSNRGEPGEVHHLGAGRIVLGEYLNMDRERVNRLVAMFVKAGVDCRATDDLKRSRWEKLVWNIPFNGLCALLQQTVDMLLAQDACRSLVRDIMLEVITGANAQGLTRPISAGYAESMLEFTDRMGEYKPSMQIDVEEGRQLEIASILRTPLAYGRERGIEMPRVEMLATLLEQKVLLPSRPA